MSYNGKYVSFVSVIESAFRDSGLDYIDYENAMEWTAELMGLMGTPYNYVDKVTDALDGAPSGLKVENYRCKLPDDLEKLISVRAVDISENGDIVGYREMIESSDVYHPLDVIGTATASSVWNPLVNIDEFEPSTEDFVHTRTNYEFNPVRIPSGLPLKYKLDHGFIFTNFIEGYVEVAYKGFPIDADGFPLIPDDPKFKEALKYHIIFKLDWKKWRINPSPQNKSIVNDSETRRDFYIGAARNKSHIPSVDKMEAIKNMWLRSNPKVNEHRNGFKTLDIQERRYNQRSRRRF